MLDIIENDLLKKHLPSVTYLRLDGGVQASNRHEIVTKFNNDPSIDVLLLTTQVSLIFSTDVSALSKITKFSITGWRIGTEFDGSRYGYLCGA